MLYLAETHFSNFFYHLHDTDDPKFSGGELTALCGEKFLGWGTKLPLSMWGKPDHLHSRYCSKCSKADVARTIQHPAPTRSDK